MMGSNRTPGLLRFRGVAVCVIVADNGIGIKRVARPAWRGWPLRARIGRSGLLRT
jgi:hypothetical protein